MRQRGRGVSSVSSVIPYFAGKSMQIVWSSVVHSIFLMVKNHDRPRLHTVFIPACLPHKPCVQLAVIMGMESLILSPPSWLQLVLFVRQCLQFPPTGYTRVFGLCIIKWRLGRGSAFLSESLDWSAKRARWSNVWKRARRCSSGLV